MTPDTIWVVATSLSTLFIILVQILQSMRIDQAQKRIVELQDYLIMLSDVMDKSLESDKKILTMIEEDLLTTELIRSTAAKRKKVV